MSEEMLHARLNAPVDYRCPLIVAQLYRSAQEASKFILKLTTERDKTISLMSQSWQHEPQGEELIYNHTKTLLEVIERIKELECFVKGVEFTILKARKHNNFTSHDGEMLKQRVEKAKQLMQKDGE